MRLILCLIIQITYTIQASCQKLDELNARPLKSDSTDLYVHLIDSEKYSKVNVCPSCQYHWLKSGKVQTTKGGYEGMLLHGLYTEFYKNGNLLQKGNFKKGLKSGEWRTWHNNGELSSIGEFRQGNRHGEFQEYSTDGILKSKRRYRKGELHGTSYAYSDSAVTIEKYRHGLLKSRFEKSESRNSQYARRSPILKKGAKHSGNHKNQKPADSKQGDNGSDNDIPNDHDSNDKNDLKKSNNEKGGNNTSNNTEKEKVTNPKKGQPKKKLQR